MNTMAALVERKALLLRKLSAIERMVQHLNYSIGRLQYPIASVNVLNEIELESVSALMERFGKLQDLLGNVFRELLVLSGEDANDMNDVLSRLEKIGILDSADDWRALRALRNEGAHDYADDDSGKSAFVNEIAAQSINLNKISMRIFEYCLKKINIKND